jgi:hypothetical protein
VAAAGVVVAVDATVAVVVVATVVVAVATGKPARGYGLA